MDTTAAVVGTGVLVVAGKWAAGETITIKLAIGVGVLALCFAVFDAVNPDLASKFALLVLFFAALKYLPPLVGKLNLAGAK
jgi:hypothetical protein